MKIGDIVMFCPNAGNSAPDSLAIVTNAFGRLVNLEVLTGPARGATYFSLGPWLSVDGGAHYALLDDPPEEEEAPLPNPPWDDQDI